MATPHGNGRDPSPWRTIRYLISLPGMSDAGVTSFTVPDEWFVEHGTPGPGLIPFRLDGRVHTLDEVIFLADCVSFDHDTPTVVRPIASSRIAKRRPIPALYPYRSKEDEALAYYNTVESTLTEAADLRIGDGAPVLRYVEFPGLLELRQRFAGVEEPLALYAMATRQVEALSEYLCLYRVLEWPHKDNGIAYVERHLQSLATYDFGKLWSHRYRSSRRSNMFARYRARAVSRVDELRRLVGPRSRDIATRLYSNRNGLAHGKDRFALDRSTDIAEIGRDLAIVKLLARLVVEGVP